MIPCPFPDILWIVSVCQGKYRQKINKKKKQKKKTRKKERKKILIERKANWTLAEDSLYIFDRKIFRKFTDFSKGKRK